MLKFKNALQAVGLPGRSANHHFEEKRSAIMRTLVMTYVAKPLCLLLIFSFVLLDLNIRTAQAGMIGTETLIQSQSNEEARSRVDAFIARQDVQEALTAHGVSPAEVKARMATLSDSEIEQIAGQLEQLPAGAGAGTIVGAVVFIFIVLLVTDILGLTKVFPFTRSVR